LAFLAEVLLNLRDFLRPLAGARLIKIVKLCYQFTFRHIRMIPRELRQQVEIAGARQVFVHFGEARPVVIDRRGRGVARLGIWARGASLCQTAALANQMPQLAEFVDGAASK
jgi:hypothetical protein